MITQANPREKVKQDYKLFEGRYREQMSLLISKGYQPLTIGGIMQGRLEETLSYDTYYDTVTGIFYAGNNQDKFKILPYSEALARVNKTTPLYDGGIKQTKQKYEQIEAREFSRKEIITGRRLTKKEAIEHQGWLELAGGDKAFHERNVERVFKLFKDNKYGKDKAMSFYIRGPQEVPNIRVVYLGGLDGWSSAVGGCRLDYYARLVGVSEKSAEGTRAGKR